MDALIKRQREIIDTIENIATNFSKDSASRKSPEYIKKRLDALDSLWGEFDINHIQISQHEPNHDYIIQNFYEKTKIRYYTIRNAISAFNEQSSSSPSTSKVTASNLSKTDELRGQQKTNFRALMRIVNGIDVEKISEKWELEDKLSTLQQRWKVIDDLHWQIDNILCGSDVIYDKEYAENEEVYENMKKLLNRKLSSTTHQQQSTPKIALPEFTGNYLQWPTFMDLYKEAIHNNPVLTKAQKMQHLKGKLKGEAERLVQHLNITAENYETCWEILNHRYNNIQVLFTKQMQLFLNQPTLVKQTAYDLKRLHDTSMEAIHAIQNLGIETTTWDPILVHILTEKLDSDTYKAYVESRKNPRELTTYDDFMDFLETKFTALEPMNKKNKIASNSNLNTPQKPTSFKSHKNMHFTYHVYDKTCPLCKNSHILIYCKKFQGLSPESKLKTIDQLNVCRNCLYCHRDKTCNSAKRCKRCNEQHHTYIHDMCMGNKVSHVQPSSSGMSTLRNASHVSSTNTEVLLSTIVLNVKCDNGSYIQLRALLDQGSQITLVTENAAQRLGLRRQKYSGTVSGVGTLSNKAKGVVQLYCKSIYDDYSFNTEALVMTRVINNLPNHTFSQQSWSHVQNIQLADPEYNISRPVDILLDASVYSEIVMSGILREGSNAPIAQQTRVGWILFGNVTSYNCNVVLNNIDEISKFWEIEDIQNDYSSDLTIEETYCETLYQKTTVRLQDGRYQVRLPMKSEFEKDLGLSKAKAVAQFKQLEKRLHTDLFLEQHYKKFMSEYIELNHMRPSQPLARPTYYLPHHGVIKLDSDTTKLRVVFNASAKTSSGHSLNDLMHCGPNLQQDLLAMILRWRKYKYVFTADIEKFYRQVQIHEQDQHLLKIIWRNNQEDKLQEYQLCTVTYGTKAAPYLAMRTVKQLVEDDGAKYPLARETLNNQLYVDDLLSGHNDLETAKNAQKQLIDILQGGGFNLRKWTSNDNRLLSHLSEQQKSGNVLDFKNAQTNKTLGLQWNPRTDHFTFKFDITLPTCEITKRTLLSGLSKIFDPLGWLSPITIKAKIIFQSVWQTKYDWDDALDESTQKQWRDLVMDLQNIQVKVPRWIGNTDGIVELHGYSDASQKAYSCVIYAKTMTENGDVSIHLVTAKTKLSPLNKQLSVPRLELCGALLLSQLMQKVKDAFVGQNLIIYAWTDSMVVLGWLQGDHKRWKTFVSNRIQKIQEILPTDSWHYIPTENNPADCASRGLAPTECLNHKLWWEGPTSLKLPIKESQQIIVTPNIEIKAKQIYVTQENKPSIIDELIAKHNSITKVTRILCWIRRFGSKTKGVTMEIRSYLTSDELNNVHSAIVKRIQYKHFTEEIIRLTNKRAVCTQSRLRKLNPFLDNEGILRVGGRLQHSYLSDEQKQPIILPSDDKLTTLLIDKAHKATLHGGPRLTLAYLRNRYWILSGNRIVKKQIRQCVTCHRFSSNKNYQLMSDLPRPRVTPSRPFTHCGVDFTGHVEVKANKGRGIKTCKGYIAVFVCFSTKAIHLELVSDLSTTTFVAALKRFCARRGTPKHMYSDNGTNFVGAAKVLKKEYDEAVKYYINTEFLDEIAQLGIEWHFNAPSWPSAGGLWEAAVRCMKHHLKRVIGEQKLTFEEFSTLLANIEACLNSRPLIPLTEDTDDLECLTPAHFLTGGSLLSPASTDETADLRSRWQLTERIYKDFWKRWSSDYLHTLQTRSKWTKERDNIKTGQIVLIKEDNAPPAKWLLGKVTELHPGKDGLVRVVSLKTKNGYIKRPIIKLSLLPIEPGEASRTDLTQTSTEKSTGTHKKGILSYVYTAILCLLMLLQPSIAQSFNITSIPKSNLVYFDRIAEIQIQQDYWKMVVYYNMTTYWRGIDNIEQYVHHLSHLCEYQPIFQTIATQLNREVKELKHYNELLKYTHKLRKRRGLVNGIGYIANTLFGVLDERYAEKYDKDIRTLQYNEKHMLELYKQQTSVIEGEYNMLKRSEAALNKQFSLISDIQKDKAKLVANQELIAYITSGSLAATVIISDLRRIQQSLIDLVTGIHSGRIDAHLMPPEQFQQQLNIISGQLPADLELPQVGNKNSVKEFYKLLRVHTSVTNDFMIFEIKLPLTSNDKYELHKIISIPQMNASRSSLIIPNFEYIAINVRKEMFISLHSSEIQLCEHLEENKMLCPLNQPIYNMRAAESICEAQIINNDKLTACATVTTTCSDKWIKLHNRSGSWLFSCCIECTVRIFCSYDMVVKSLTGVGLIALGQGCLLRGTNFTIQSFNNFHSTMRSEQEELNTPLLSDINKLITNSNISSSYAMTETQSDVLSALHNKIEEIKRQQEQVTGEVSSHDIHHYTMVYGLIGVAGAACAVWWIRRRLARTPRPLRADNGHTNVVCDEIEMGNIASVSERVTVSKSVDKANSPILS